MLDTLILLTAVLLGYAFLRSYGGEGFSIKAKAKPASTPEGKRARIMALIVSVIIFSAVIFVFRRQNDTSSWVYFAVTLLIGIVIVFAPILKKKIK